MPPLVAFLRVAAAVAITTAALVLPFAYATSTWTFDLLVACGSAFTIGTLFGVRAPGGANPLLGASAAVLVGLPAALFAGLIPGNGVMLLYPPLHGIAAGFLWATQPHPPRTPGEGLKLAFGTGLWLGIGMTPALPPTGVATGLLASLLVAPIIEYRRLANCQRNGEAAGRATLVVLVLLKIALTIGSLILVRHDEGLSYGTAIAIIVPCILLVPFVFFTGTVAIVRWCRPRIRLLRDVAECMRAFYVPLGAFAIGYLVLVVAFAGLYGTIHRWDPAAFQFAAANQGTGIGDWLFTAFYVATSQSLVDVVPRSGAAKLAVGVQLTLCLAWAVVVFAAVMTRVHPVLQRISERNAERDESQPPQ